MNGFLTQTGSFLQCHISTKTTGFQHLFEISPHCIACLFFGLREFVTQTNQMRRRDFIQIQIPDFCIDGRHQVFVVIYCFRRKLNFGVIFQPNLRVLLELDMRVIADSKLNGILKHDRLPLCFFLRSGF